MPKYTYHCDKCNKDFEVIHSIKNKLETCEECEGSLVRIPSYVFIDSGHEKLANDRKVGDIVKDHIKESKRELKKEQERISSQEYK